MIDFVSSHPDAHPQTVACARLIAAVIAQAIRDACERPHDREKKECMNLYVDARHAIEFLFDDRSRFANYALLIGASHEAIREALLQPTGGGIDEMSRRIIRLRFQWFNHSKDIEHANVKSLVKPRRRASCPSAPKPSV